MSYKLWSIIVILILLWIIGLATNVTFGGYLHLLLLAAAVTGFVVFLLGRSQSSGESS